MSQNQSSFSAILINSPDIFACLCQGILEIPENTAAKLSELISLQSH